MTFTPYNFSHPNWLSQITREKTRDRQLRFWLHVKHSITEPPIYKLPFATASDAHSFARKIRRLYSKLSDRELVKILEREAAATGSIPFLECEHLARYGIDSEQDARTHQKNVFLQKRDAPATRSKRRKGYYH